MYAVVKEHLRSLEGWKDFAIKADLNLSKPFLVEEAYRGYIYKTWFLPAEGLTLVSTPLDKSLEDYL